MVELRGVEGCLEMRMVAGWVALLKVWVLPPRLWQSFGGVLEGLLFVQRKGYEVVELDIDSLVAVQCLNGETMGSAAGWSLVHRIKCIMQTGWRVKVKNIYREANKVADGMASMGCELDGGVVFYDDPPPLVQQLVAFHVLGVATPRVIPL